MSELMRELSRLKICNIPGNPEFIRQLKEAFRAGWEAREVMANKRVAEIEKAATLKERERCATKAENYSAVLADEIRRG